MPVTIGSKITNPGYCSCTIIEIATSPRMNRPVYRKTQKANTIGFIHSVLNVHGQMEILAENYH